MSVILQWYFALGSGSRAWLVASLSEQLTRKPSGIACFFRCGSLDWFVLSLVVVGLDVFVYLRHGRVLNDQRELSGPVLRDELLRRGGQEHVLQFAVDFLLVHVAHDVQEGSDFTC